MELKPCPFCGGEVTHEIDSWGSMSWIECRVCGRMLATRCDGLPDDPPSPAVVFNNRPLEDALTVSRDEWKTRACQEELRADALEIERDLRRKHGSPKSNSEWMCDEAGQ